ncbi:MAG: aminotransferase class III-fold pyridoxal phosphate-dependent enzyme [Proteobacteria bacterium]|nr:aminotransferase class III-fold pyridoxal phosphate-dependent enzyme [Pseudomonadota bacterium]
MNASPTPCTTCLHVTSEEIIHLDRRNLWHPFTPNSLWLDPSFTPISIASGEGPWLISTDGKRYLDGNSSIWTNLHGHRHPKINQAIRHQLDQIAHSSFLGLTHEPAVRLAEELLRYVQPAREETPGLRRVFFSDDGSTAMEAGLKMILQSFAQRTKSAHPVSLAGRGVPWGHRGGDESGSQGLLSSALSARSLPHKESHGPFLLSLPLQPCKTRKRRRPLLPEM